MSDWSVAAAMCDADADHRWPSSRPPAQAPPAHLALTRPNAPSTPPHPNNPHPNCRTARPRRPRPASSRSLARTWRARARRGRTCDSCRRRCTTSPPPLPCLAATGERSLNGGTCTPPSWPRHVPDSFSPYSAPSCFPSADATVCSRRTVTVNTASSQHSTAMQEWATLAAAGRGYSGHGKAASLLPGSQYIVTSGLLIVAACRGVLECTGTSA